MRDSKYILIDRFFFPSARILREELEKKSKKKWWIVTEPTKLKKAPEIRYGCSSRPFPNEHGINSPEFISLASNKLNFSKLMLENNIYTPKFTRLHNVEQFIFPLMIRETLTASGGKGIAVIKSQQELGNVEGNPWTTPFVTMQFELRVHLYKNKILKVFKKVFSRENEQESEFAVRNMHNGYHFSLVNLENFSKLQPVVEAVYNVLPQGSSICALDVGWDAVNRKYFVIEANSAPGLNSLSAELYATNILETLEIPIVEG